MQSQSRTTSELCCGIGLENKHSTPSFGFAVTVALLLTQQRREFARRWIWIFTGQPQGTTIGLFDFQYREYSPVQGRWVSPDPAGLQAVDFTNPQSWDRYAYGLNNPLANIDPRGLFCAYVNDAGNGVERVSTPIVVRANARRAVGTGYREIMVGDLG